MDSPRSAESDKRMVSTQLFLASTETHRLSIPFEARLPLAILGGSATGFALGLSYGAKVSGLRFRAENAHRLPNSAVGWYLYHKSKNYSVINGGVKGGLKMGFKIGFGAGSFFAVEEAIDQVRGGRKDFLSTTVAGLGVAGGFSVWNRFPLVTAARTAKTGLLFGLGFGLVQDALSLARGRRLAYVDFLLGTNRRTKPEMLR